MGTTARHYVYVLGFLFNDDGDRVVLIQKAPDRGPAAVRGRMNGVGGHVKDGETPEQAMTREGLEEAGVDVEWECVGLNHGHDWTVHLFRAFSTEKYEQAHTMTDEEICFRGVPLPRAITAKGEYAEHVVTLVEALRDLRLKKIDIELSV